MKQLVQSPLTTAAHPIYFLLCIGHCWAQETTRRRVFPARLCSSFPVMLILVCANRPLQYLCAELLITLPLLFYGHSVSNTH